MATNNDFVIEFIGQLDKSELNKAIEEFSRKQIDLKVNTDEIKEAIKEFAKANDIKLSTRELNAWTKKFMKAMADAEKANKQRADNEKQNLIENARLQEEMINQAINGILAETDAQVQLNQTIRDMNTAMQQKDAKQLQNITNEYDKIGKKIKTITDNNVGFLKNNEEIGAQVKKLQAEYEQLGKSFASGDVNSIASGMVNLRQNVDEVTSSIRQAKSATQTFGEMLKENFTKFGAWSIITFGYFEMLRVIKDGVNQVMELDASLVELKKVTDLSGASLQRFTEDAFKAGQEVGRTGKEVIDATAEFARAGYSIRDSLDLGTEALKLSNVGDGIDSVSQSSLVLISILKAYKMEASQASQITDVLNEVSNNAAIGFGDLSNGIQRSAGILAQSNTSLSEAVALLTAGQVSLQNIEKVSSGINVVSQRLRG